MRPESPAVMEAKVIAADRCCGHPPSMYMLLGNSISKKQQFGSASNEISDIDIEKLRLQSDEDILNEIFWSSPSPTKPSEKLIGLK